MTSVHTTQTPTSADVSDSTQYTLGMAWTSAVPGMATGIRVYGSTTAPASALVGVLWSITSEAAGTELARVTFGSHVSGAWYDAHFATPVEIAVGTYYIASYITPDYFALTSFGFLSAPIVNGDLTGIQSGSPYANGRLHVGDGYPEVASSQQSDYFADVIFEPHRPPQSHVLSGATHRATRW